MMRLAFMTGIMRLCAFIMTLTSIPDEKRMEGMDSIRDQIGRFALGEMAKRGDFPPPEHDMGPKGGLIRAFNK